MSDIQLAVVTTEGVPIDPECAFTHADWEARNRAYNENSLTEVEWMVDKLRYHAARPRAGWNILNVMQVQLEVSLYDRELIAKVEQLFWDLKAALDEQERTNG